VNCQCLAARASEFFQEKDFVHFIRSRLGSNVVCISTRASSHQVRLPHRGPSQPAEPASGEGQYSVQHRCSLHSDWNPLQPADPRRAGERGGCLPESRRWVSSRLPPTASALTQVPSQTPKPAGARPASSTGTRSVRTLAWRVASCYLCLGCS
jgi:hypothetical protein